MKLTKKTIEITSKNDLIIKCVCCGRNIKLEETQTLNQNSLVNKNGLCKKCRVYYSVIADSLDEEEYKIVKEQFS